VTNADLFVFT
jgi:hypothetical protein